MLIYSSRQAIQTRQNKFPKWNRNGSLLAERINGGVWIVETPAYPCSPPGRWARKMGGDPPHINLPTFVIHLWLG